MDRMDCIETFVNVLESASFSGAAKRMGITQSTVSKRIAMLEQSFGTSLFLRTTRRLTPTEDAQRMYHQARELLEAFQRTQAAARNASPEPEGTLSVSVPSSMGRHLIMPIVSDFLREYPEVGVNVRLSERQINLVEEGIELALRIGELADSSLRARSIGRVRRFLVASPKYLKFHSVPDNPTDLFSHSCLGYSRFGTPDTWVFEGETGRHVINAECRVKLDDADALQSAVVYGMGIAILPNWLVHPWVDQGKLQIVLPDYTVPSLPLNVVYNGATTLSLRARLFLDFLAARRNQLVMTD